MTDDDRDLIAGEALGGSSPDESARVAELVAKDAAAAAELEGHRATVAALEAGVARAVPADDLFERILADVEPAPAPPPRRLRRRWVPRLATAGVAAAAAVVALAVFTGGRGAPDAQAAVVGTTQFSEVSGEAKLYGDAVSYTHLTLPTILRV